MINLLMHFKGNYPDCLQFDLFRTNEQLHLINSYDFDIENIVRLPMNLPDANNLMEQKKNRIKRFSD